MDVDAVLRVCGHASEETRFGTREWPHVVIENWSLRICHLPFFNFRGQRARGIFRRKGAAGNGAFVWASLWMGAGRRRFMRDEEFVEGAGDFSASFGRHARGQEASGALAFDAPEDAGGAGAFAAAAPGGLFAQVGSRVGPGCGEHQAGLFADPLGAGAGEFKEFSNKRRGWRVGLAHQFQGAELLSGLALAQGGEDDGGMTPGAHAEAGEGFPDRFHFQAEGGLGRVWRQEGGADQQVARVPPGFQHRLDEIGGEDGTGAATARPGVEGQLCGFDQEQLEPVEGRVAEDAGHAGAEGAGGGFIDLAKAEVELRGEGRRGLEEAASGAVRPGWRERSGDAEAQFVGGLLEGGEFGEDFGVRAVRQKADKAGGHIAGQCIEGRKILR